MLALRQLLRWSFAISAIVLIPTAIGGFANLAHVEYVAFRFLRYSIFAGFLAASAVFAVAWWTTRAQRAARSMWAIAASVVNVAAGIVVLRYTSQITLAGPQLLLIAAGIAGLIVFSRRGTLPAAAAAANRLPIAGDRTSPWADHAATVLFVVAQLAAVRFWSGWVYSHDPSSGFGIASIVLIVLAALTTSMLHECGHVLAAWAFQMKLLSFNVGPLHWRKRERRWSFEFHGAGLITLGGAVGVAPTNQRQPRWQDISMIAAGPFANIFFGLVALWAALQAKETFHPRTWEFLALTASCCLIAAVFNLFPFQAERGSYSDGARIFQLLTDSPVLELHRVSTGIASTLVTSRRPRDMDADAIQRAARRFPHELRGLNLQLCATHSFTDSGRLPEARAALAEAEAIYRDSAIDLPAALHTGIVFDHAYLNRDAAAARLWWERMQQKKPDRPNVSYWLARTALLWIEGRFDEAEQAWQWADAEARKLPQFGAYEFDRHRCALLRKELDRVAPASQSQPIVDRPRYIPKREPMPYRIFGVNTAATAAD